MVGITVKYRVVNWLFVQVVKSVSQKYNPTPETLLLLEEFRKMLNDCLRIGLVENVTSKQSLAKKAYYELVLGFQVGVFQAHNPMSSSD